jgi:LmbE family N-acetylglucosaminyl deacetylase
VIAGPILVVAAHPDDEALAAAGTLDRARRNGDAVHILILSAAVLSRNLAAAEAARVKQARLADAERAAARLGAGLTVADLPDNGFDTVPALDIVRLVEAAVARVRPRTVLTHWPHDLSLDHRATALAVLAACRPQPGRATPALLAFEVRSSTDWMPASAGAPFVASVYVALDDAAWAAKTALLEIYASEMRPPPHPRSRDGVDALARLRGGEAGCARAEAFALLRWVVGP